MKSKIFVLLGVILLSSVLAVKNATAKERLALVIGNGQYAKLSPLPNPVNDGALLSKTLADLNFKVTEVYDASLDDMHDAIRQFGQRLEISGSDSIGFFFYAGHAVQLKGANYLLPIDAKITAVDDLETQALHMEVIMDRVSQAELSASFIVVDACRNNPFPQSMPIPDGLAQLRAPRLSVVAYSTEPGGVALDGLGNNSPYTTALVDEIMQPGVPAEQMFKRVRRRLLDATQSQQISWESSSLTEDIFFVPNSAGTVSSSEFTSTRPKLEIDWDNYDWAEMTKQQRKHWSVLGWNEESWDEETYEPESESKIWNGLSDVEMAAATALGYTKDIWDGTW